MPVVEDRRPTDESETPPFPEADHYVWAAAGSFRCGNPADYEDELPDDVDLSPVESYSGEGERIPAVVFDPGEELPPSLARDIWPSFHDRIAAFADGRRVDEGGRNEDPGALETWGASRGASTE